MLYYSEEDPRGLTFPTIVQPVKVVFQFCKMLCRKIVYKNN